jgi:hypothetical protein
MNAPAPIAALPAAAPIGVIDLAGSWSLADGSGGCSTTINLPSDVHSALFAAELIPDPYYGRNEYDVRWVAERDWVMSREFALDDPAMDLVIDGLDTIAEVRVNGKTVLEAANSFRTWRADISQAAKSGNNRIEIVDPVEHCGGRAASGRSALLRSMAQGQLSDPQRQHAAQAAMRFRLGLEHRAGAARRSRGNPAGAEAAARLADVQVVHQRHDGSRDAQPDCED